LRLAIDYSGAAAFAGAYFVTYFRSHGHGDLQLATAWLVGASALALMAGLLVERRIAPLPLLYGGAALVFGALTLRFKDPIFIAMKTTVIDTALGATMLIGLALGKSPIRLLLSDTLKLSDQAWARLTFRFGLFFIAMAVLNMVVWFGAPRELWVVFRMPGLLIISLVFAATQVPMMLKEAKSIEAAAAIAETQQ
jgi:intracellular septation protein